MSISSLPCILHGLLPTTAGFGGLHADVGWLPFNRFGFGFGEDHNTNSFIGDQGFALSKIGHKYGSWPMVFIQWVFCATATTIPHGSVAERVHLATVIG